MDFVGWRGDIRNGDLSELIISESLEIFAAEGKIGDVLDDMGIELLFDSGEGGLVEGCCISCSY